MFGIGLVDELEKQKQANRSREEEFGEYEKN